MKKFVLLTSALTLFAIFGCSKKDVPKEIVAGAESSYEQAATLVANKSYAEALPMLDKALGEGGGLNADLVGEAYIKRAICNAELGNTDKAEADLVEAEKGAANEAGLLVAKGVIAKKKGDSVTADSNFSKAREIDPEVKIPR